MITDYEDDAHFCLKCHQTIIGLDNYVDHRKTGCSKSLIHPPKSPLPSQLLPPDEINLKADDFFSSLELRSSSKKTPQQQPQSTPGKNFSGVLTRSKTSAIQASSSRENAEPQQSKSGKNVWIGGHQLKELGHGDNQSRLIKAVDNLEKHKDDPPRVEIYEESDDESEEYDYEDDNSSSDEDAPPRHHTGGKWKPSSPIQWSRDNRDWNIPPPSYTGGKWKPPPSAHTKGKWKPSVEDDNVPPPTFTGSKWVSSKKQLYPNPPPSHTKGKWKPREEDFPPPSHTKGKWSRSNEAEEAKSEEPAKEDKKEVKEELELDMNYTRGKWLPSPSKQFVMITEDSPLRKSSGTVQYWCSPCNRRLASKVVYDRHLKSELHFKRTLHEGEFDDGAVIKRVRTKPPVMILADDNSRMSNKVEKKRRRRKTFERCGVCQSRVCKYLMGKHLISHYHCRKGDISTDLAKSMVLENIASIVWESPFQCSICKFYCNTHDYFLDHWRSDFHKNKDMIHSGYFYCMFCKHKGSNLSEMYDHLTSAEHIEVVSVINRSVPIVIKKISLVQCMTCNAEFLYNVQLIDHCKKLKHADTKLENVQQECVRCIDCEQSFNSNVSLQRHRRLVHKDEYSFCGPCNMTFADATEAKTHRKTSEHRYATQEKKSGKNLLRKCKYCDECFQNFLLLKDHLKERHPEQKVKCPHCGTTFSVTQELTNHIRSKSCKFEESQQSEGRLRCEKCPFASNSPAELLFHHVLHAEPTVVGSSKVEGVSTKPIPKYCCPVCEKFFPKASLLGHIRTHTQEKPFECKICGAKFARKNNLMFHEKNHEKNQVAKKNNDGRKSFLCSTCGAAFGKQFTLQQHMITHTGKPCKCPQPGCSYTARKMSEIKCHLQIHSENRQYGCGSCTYKGKTKSQLRRHLTIHDDVKKHSCNHCSFTARTAAHLRRHTRLHTGAKPYCCPHCTYKCNTLENLRKHVLSTNKHPGKCIYECKFCKSGEKFETNLAKEFKDHLISIHFEVFAKTSQAASYVAGIYEVQQDSTFIREMEIEEINARDERSFVPQVVKIEEKNENVLKLKTNEDPIVAQLVTPELPMFIIPKDGASVAETVNDPWNLVGRYDVEESGTLVPFQNDGDALFQEF